ncbi:unnamed protein product [Rotaria socialis]|uniref:DYW domain-containing protein n=3 Tax=Rotaria socialis TaxID=392032 RepID=A0A820WNZ6_9BILA|nr:unnamed protein product [Rotaria socialis]CAF4520389.1 unnamed protein product [Rotaria socialis]
MCDKVLGLFEEITLNLSDVSYTIIFNACAQVSIDRAMKIGRKLLNQIHKNFLNDNKLLTSAINMLMRFGDVSSAENLFQMIQKKNIITYGTMMNGYNINNEPLKSLKLFEDMKRDDINADAIVLIILIGACARIGMLSKCQSIFAQIPLHLYENQRIRNFINSYVVNSFGLNRMDSEALDLYQKMPNNLQDEVSSICVLNACSHSGLLNEAHSIFNEVSHKTKKIITAMQFKAHDRSHSRSKEIYADAERISSELIKHGHNYDSSWITRPLHENETIESVLFAHSERLAIAFNFIQETKPSFIQITKKSSCLR